MIGRQGMWKRGKAPKSTKYETVRNEADRLVRQYTSGEVAGGTTGFLTKMGYLTHRLMEENSKLRNSSNINLQNIEGEKNDKSLIPENEFPGRLHINRLQEMLDQGLGEHSFRIQNSPYKNRVVGQSAKVTASILNNENQQKYDFKNKKCLKCKRKFINGVLKKSKVIKCNGCGGFVHESSSVGCSVDMKRGSPNYYCPDCEPFSLDTQKQRNNTEQLLIDTIEIENTLPQTYDNSQHKQSGNLTELQNQILHDEMNVEYLSDYEKIRLNNMKERQAMLESIDFETNDLNFIRTTPNLVSNLDTIVSTRQELSINNSLIVPQAESSRLSQQRDTILINTIVESRQELSLHLVLEESEVRENTDKNKNSEKVEIEDCLVCKFCMDKPKYGGKGTLKQRCINKPKKTKAIKRKPSLEGEGGRVLRRRQY